MYDAVSATESTRKGYDKDIGESASFPGLVLFLWTIFHIHDWFIEEKTV